MKTPEPQTELSESSQKLMREVLSAKASPGRRLFATEALRCLDRLNEVRAKLDGGQLTGAVRYGSIELELKLRKQFAAMWSRLGLHFVPMIDGRIEK